MSETTKKRVNKTEEQLKAELFDKKAEEFKVELQALEDKYSFRLEAILNYSVRGIVPTINVVPVKKEVIEVKKAKKEETKTEDVV